MDDTLEARVQELWDRKGIEEAMVRYTRGLDRLDLDLYRSSFSRDGLDNHGPAKSPEDFLEGWMPQQAARELTEHHISNFTIEIDGDTAHAESYYMVAVKNTDEDFVNLFGGRYADRLVNEDGTWLMAVRVVIPSFHAQAPTAVGSTIMSRSNWGRRSSEDPTYERPLRPKYDMGV